MIGAGDLDRKIKVEKATLTRNTAGESISTWATFAEVWAKVEPVAGREFFQLAQAQAQVDVKFTIRWLVGLTHDMRIIFDSRTYDIVHLAEFYRDNRIEIMGKALAT